MVFSSTLFIFYFLPVFLIIYYLLPIKLKNYFILLSSIFFYAWGAPKFIFLVLLILIINFYIVKSLAYNKKKLLLSTSIILNLGILAYFKYANFFIENINAFLGTIGITNIAWTHVALPIGISFFIFQSITYSLDVYRKKHKPLVNLSDYLLYILMFPQLIAGPIVRFHTIADEIEDRKANETHKNKVLGFYQFVLGLSKKVLIANILGQEADKIYAMDLDSINASIAWVAALAYTFQIYFDFSGYSDMAIGIGRMIGFKFPENFNNPYISKSITEFWRRWHITLGQFMKDYLYIPLGGNRVSKKWFLYRNLAVVFLLSGLWHGASWNFVVWGAFHGIFLILDRLFLERLLLKSGRFIAIGITFFITIIGWVIFRNEDLNFAFGLINKMFNVGQFKQITLDSEFTTTLVIAIIFSFITEFQFGKKMQDFVYCKSERALTAKLPLFAILFIISVSYIVSSGFNPFIYFRF